MSSSRQSSQSSVAPRRRRKRRVINVRRLILALLLTALAGELLVVILTSPRFAVERIQVRGTRVISAAQVARGLHYLVGSNIFTANKREIADTLRRDPVVADVHLHRRLPRILVIDITERRAQLVLNTGALLYEVDGSGVPFRKVSAANPKLPMICCAISGPVILGRALKSPAFASARDCLIRARGKKEFRVAKIAVDPAGHLCLNVREGFEVRLGRPDQIATKLDIVCRLVQQAPDFRRRGMYVDVSCPEAPACKLAQ